MSLRSSSVGLGELCSLYVSFLVLRDTTINRNFKSSLSVYMKIFAILQLCKKA